MAPRTSSITDFFGKKASSVALAPLVVDLVSPRLLTPRLGTPRAPPQAPDPPFMERPIEIEPMDMDDPEYLNAGGYTGLGAGSDSSSGRAPQMRVGVMASISALCTMFMHYVYMHDVYACFCFHFLQ